MVREAQMRLVELPLDPPEAPVPTFWSTDSADHCASASSEAGSGADWDGGADWGGSADPYAIPGAKNAARAAAVSEVSSSVIEYREFIPCTLQPAPCTLHPAPCTLHPAP